MGGMYYLRPMISLFEKFPSSKFFFDFPLYYIVASQPLNLNNTANLKQNPKRFCMFNQRPIWSCIIKKSEDKKTRDTVPLIFAAPNLLPLTFRPLPINLYSFSLALYTSQNLREPKNEEKKVRVGLAKCLAYHCHRRCRINFEFNLCRNSFFLSELYRILVIAAS
jgi:hypothetical protein